MSTCTTETLPLSNSQFTVPISAVDADNDAIITRESALSFRDLPTELRYMIYSFILDHSGVIHVWTRHSMAQHCNTDTINLMHVNKFFRSEVEDFFYENQAFQFRSFEAMTRFSRDVGTRHVAKIRNIMLGSNMCGRNPKAFNAQISRAARPFKSVNRIICLRIRSRPRWGGSNSRRLPILKNDIKILGIVYSFPIFKTERAVLNELFRDPVQTYVSYRWSYGVEIGTKDMTPMLNLTNTTEDPEKYERAVYCRSRIYRQEMDFEDYEKKVKFEINRKSNTQRDNLGVKGSKWNAVAGEDTEW